MPELVACICTELHWYSTVQIYVYRHVWICEMADLPISDVSQL